MNVTPVSLKKRLGLELFSRWRDGFIKQHPLNYLFWECTLRCNLSCVHCGSDCRKIPYASSAARPPDMPFEDFIKTIDIIVPHVNPHTTMIVLTGGEPLLRNDLEQCGHELYKRAFPWGMVTNGFILDKKRYAKLEQAGLRSITVSLDGFEESHNRLRGHPESHKNALNAIRMIVQSNSGAAFDVVTCVNRWNFNELPALKELLIKEGVKAWRIFTVSPIGRAAISDMAAENRDLHLDASLFKQLFDFISVTRKEGAIKTNYGCEGFLGNYETEVRDSFFFCRAGISVGSVLADGSISACPNIRPHFTQGNIHNDNFMDVWNNRYQIFRDRSWAKKGECAACRYFKYCKGGAMHLRGKDRNLLFCHLSRLQD
ncbi:MAG: TIGR04133 family radical SAM/SPASM protein [Treponema sp.]|jgi:radical SAM enzyme (rSAM/lipoprotein system)|nr:TIGR04133 family radical SAM/SPASM protein [Treponema sp.]